MTFSRTGSQDTTQKDAYLHFELPSVPSGTVLPLAGIARNYHASFSHRLGRNCQRKHSYFRGFGDGKTFFHEIVSKIPEAIANLSLIPRDCTELLCLHSLSSLLLYLNVGVLSFVRFAVAEVFLFVLFCCFSVLFAMNYLLNILVIFPPHSPKQDRDAWLNLATLWTDSFVFIFHFSQLV